MPLSEFEIIKRYFTYRARHAVLGVGDDAAIVRVRRGMELAVSADMLVSGRHFFPDADAEPLGHKALAVNLSDMAAMGAIPRWATLSIALPRVDPRWLKGFMGGFLRLARRHGVDLVGGDTTRGPLAICVQIIGEVPAGTALRRDGARAGDDIWVSGTLGAAALALAAARGRVRLAPAERRQVEGRLHEPTPRVALGAALRGLARSAIDVSDGLIADLGHICERSRVAAAVEFARLPAAPVLQRRLDRSAARAALLAGGDDYELCFTAAHSRRDAIARVARRQRIRLTRIGTIVPRRGRNPVVFVTDAAGRLVRAERGGFDHFG
jgi:thiamine-monophosphate kinase